MKKKKKRKKRRKKYVHIVYVPNMKQSVEIKPSDLNKFKCKTLYAHFLEYIITCVYELKKITNCKFTNCAKGIKCNLSFSNFANDDLK